MAKTSNPTLTISPLQPKLRTLTNTLNGLLRRMGAGEDICIEELDTLISSGFPARNFIKLGQDGVYEGRHGVLMLSAARALREYAKAQFEWENPLPAGNTVSEAEYVRLTRERREKMTRELGFAW